MLPLPSLDTGSKYKVCCGKELCSGCIHAVGLRDNGVGLCPFCRTPAPVSGEEYIARLKKRVEVGDAIAIYSLGCCYDEGVYGFPLDHTKALELWPQAGELGYARAYHNIGGLYNNGVVGVERDKKKANHYYELAAMGGDATARHNLGIFEGRLELWMGH